MHSSPFIPRQTPPGRATARLSDYRPDRAERASGHPLAGHKIAVVDFGSQYAHLIANRIRRLGVYAEILLPDTPAVKLAQYKGIVLSGGPNSVYAPGAPTIDKKVFDLGIPILAICYGLHLVAHLLGGKVAAGSTKEYGFAKLKITKKIGIFKGVSKNTQVWMSHGDTVTKLPQGFTAAGKTYDCEYAAFANVKRNIFCTQYHVEVAHTTEGIKMLDNFLRICKAKREWKIETFLQGKMRQIRQTLKGRKVFLLVSGGVDSTVAYALLAETLGSDRVYALFVDTGFLRKDEGQKTVLALRKIGVKNFHMLNAKKEFMKALSGVTSPEEKREIIGDLFIQIQKQAVKKLNLNPKEWVLGQGTIYPDTIESAGTKHSDKIKTHHNRVPEILRLMKQGKVIEPLAELYKDEVRQLGKQLGLPDVIVWKHPFPGPGLAVRILCTSKKEAAQKNHYTEDESIAAFIKSYGLSGKIMPIKSVGVQGDGRTYKNPLVVWGKPLPFSKLEKISTALTNRYREINRVCLLLHPAEVKSVKLQAAALTEKRVRFLQEIDDIVMKFMKQNHFEREVWQFPVVLVPLRINGIKKEAVVLRPICSQEAMTANFYDMPRALLKKLTQKLASHVSAILYDITNKPPGTIEWE